MRRDARTKIDPPSAGFVVRKLRVGFVLAPRFTLTAFAGFVDALRLAADDGDRSRRIRCDWDILGRQGEAIVSSCGAAVSPWAEMIEPSRYDYIVVVGGLLHGGQKVLPGTFTFLRQAARNGVPLVGLCTGPLILARAGLLEGYDVCASWFHREDFLDEFPGLSVRSDKMFVVDRDRMTCAGGTSVVHLAAYLIERHCGRTEAVKSLRILIEDAPLPSNLLQPAASLTRKASDSLVCEAMLIIEQNLNDGSLFSRLPGALGVSLRQLERRFVADLGITLREYRLHLRLARAKWMIEQTDRSITQVALDCGFNDCSHFSRSFKIQFDQTPSQLRAIARKCEPIV
jgi:transcriptional regulator GlxA family with amidase domain